VVAQTLPLPLTVTGPTGSGGVLTSTVLVGLLLFGNFMGSSEQPTMTMRPATAQANAAMRVNRLMIFFAISSFCR
jgi:hypothetical protein